MLKPFLKSTVFYFNKITSTAKSHIIFCHSKMERFAKMVNGWKPLTIFAKSSILYVWLGSECTYAVHQANNLDVMKVNIIDNRVK